MSNLAIRSLVAVVSIPLILLLTITGGWFFFGLIALLSALGLHEFYMLARHRGALPQLATGLIMGLCVNGIFFRRMRPVAEEMFAGLGVSLSQNMFMYVFIFFVVLILVTELFRNRPSPSLNAGTTLLGICYVSLFFGTLIGIREMFTSQMFPGESAEIVYGWGGSTVLVMFASVWLCDSAAYFVGLGLGRNKLFPRVSPGKTREGAVGGFLAAVAGFVLGKILFLPFMSMWSAIVCGVIVGSVGQVGDMVESLFKRDSNVKDSSAIIPGHGGVLDRFDSLLLVSPVLFLYLQCVVLGMK